MVNLEIGARSMLGDYIRRKEVVAVLKGSAENASKGYNQQFAVCMQQLITKVGLIVSEMVVTPKMRYGTCLAAIEYLSKILSDRNIEKDMRACMVNDAANRVKHSLDKAIPIDIDEVVNNYNQIISRLAKYFGMDEFLRLNISYKNGKTGNILESQRVEMDNRKKKPPVDNNKSFLDNKKGSIESKFAEQVSIKYEKLGNNKIKFRLPSCYSFDPYDKVAFCDFTMNWEFNTGEEVQITVLNALNKRPLGGGLIRMNDKKERKFRLKLEQKDLDSSTLKLIVNVDLIKNVQVKKFRKKFVVKGVLFKKRFEEMEEYFDTERHVVQSLKLEMENILQKERKA